MRLLSWNCQGLGNPWTIRSLRKIVWDQAPNVCFLMETRLDKDGFEEWCGDLPFWNKIVVKQPNTGGGLALLWKEDVQLDLINYTMHHVMVKVREADGFARYLTCFYGWPEADQRFKSWILLNHLRSFVHGPWMCIGDFNAILSSSEKLSKRPPQARLIDEFREALEMNELKDLGYKGYQYTWNNKRPGEANTRERLDRAVANGEWREKFPMTTVTHISSHTSDHAPIILQTKSLMDRCKTSGGCGFKFEESWLLWDDCEGVIKEVWERNIEDSLGLEAVSAEECDRIEECLQAVPCKVTEEMRQSLSREVSADEIWEALFQMGPTKAPGHDGMNALFYQKFWHIVGDNVVSAVLDFLQSGNMVSEINHTNIVLIPKVKSPEKMSDFRPISLCNVIYKIISKVLANRLKQVLPQIISLTQSAFVPGRLITDNVLVAYETLHTMHGRKKGKKGSLALKLDVSKAYDRVEWDFLRAIMLKLGFPEIWINWVMTCITSPSFSVLINGKPFGCIAPSRGLRQGDPLSPYLFLLCAEGFTALLAKVEMEERIHGVSICKRAPRISHLLFANDSSLFCQATQREVTAVTDILHIYAQASGQCINMEKSSVLFSSNTPVTQKEWIKSTFGVKEVVCFETYLGLPTMVGRAKYQAFAYLKDLVWRKLQSWKENGIHVLWECGVARGIWAGSLVKLQKSTQGQGDVLQLFTELLQRLSTEEFEVFLIVAWLIWNQRNSVIHGGRVKDPHLGSSGVGAIIRNERGEVMAALSAKGPFVQDNEEAETLACRKALEFAIDVGISDLIIEGDNASVMRAVASNFMDGSRLGNVLEDIHCLMSGLRWSFVSCVKRSANTVAHCLARFARNVSDELVWIEDSPQPAKEALYNDSLIFS
nr:uncharacterized protein LOC112035046 [Quercus suber]